LDKAGLIRLSTLEGSVMHAVFTLLANLLTPFGAIVAITLAVRAALHPLTRAAVRGERAKLRLAPKLAELQRRHAKNPAKAAEESLALHRAEGVSPFAGLLPVLAQAPVFFLLYRAVAAEGAGTLLGQHLLSGAAPLFALVLAGVAVVAWLTSRRTATLMRTTATLSRSSAAASSGAGLLGKLSRVLPYTTVAFAAFVPMALAVYLLTSASWTLVENTLLRRGLPG
jgi:YidC/Oxa1 family membrane protein insertase